METLTENIIGNPVWIISLLAVVEVALFLIKRNGYKVANVFLFIPLILIVCLIGLDLMFESRRELLETTIHKMGESYNERDFEYIRTRISDKFRGYSGTRAGLVSQMKIKGKNIKLISLSVSDIEISGKRAELVITTLVEAKIHGASTRPNVKWRTFWVWSQEMWKLQEVRNPIIGAGL